MNLINGTHHSCEIREHAFIVLQEYIIIFPMTDPIMNNDCERREYHSLSRAELAKGAMAP